MSSAPTLEQNLSIDTNFDPPKFSLDNTFKSTKLCELHFQDLTPEDEERRRRRRERNKVRRRILRCLQKLNKVISQKQNRHGAENIIWQ
jgi:hypothetical protein